MVKHGKKNVKMVKKRSQTWSEIVKIVKTVQNCQKWSNMVKCAQTWLKIVKHRQQMSKMAKMVKYGQQ